MQTEPMKINKTNVARILRESIFDPKKDKLMGIVVEIGNYDYYIKRAQELIASISFCRSPIQRQNALQTAISLLAIARLVGDV